MKQKYHVLKFLMAAGVCVVAEQLQAEEIQLASIIENSCICAQTGGSGSSLGHAYEVAVANCTCAPMECPNGTIDLGQVKECSGVNFREVNVGGVQTPTYECHNTFGNNFTCHTKCSVVRRCATALG